MSGIILKVPIGNPFSYSIVSSSLPKKYIFAFLAFGIHEPGDSFDGQLIDVAQQLAAFPVVDAGIKHTAPEPSVGKIAQDVVARHLLVGGRLDRVFDVEQQHVGIDACGTAHQPVVMGRDEHQASE